MSISPFGLSSSTSEVQDIDNLNIPNLFDNCNFEISQICGNSSGIPSATPSPVADRWLVNAVFSAGTCTYSRNSDVPTESNNRYCVRLTHSSTATISPYVIYQNLLNSTWYMLQSRAYTISFWYKSNVTTANALRLTLKPPVAAALTIDFTANVTDTWQKFTYTIPTTSGLVPDSTKDLFDTTVISSTTSYISIGWSGVTVNLNDYFSICDISLSLGTTSPSPCPMKHVSIGGEYRNAQRYTFKSFIYSVLPARNIDATNSTAIGITGAAATVNTTYQAPAVFHPVRLITTPTSNLLYNPYADVAGTARNITAASNVNATMVGELSYGSIVISQSVTAGDKIRYHSTHRVGF